MKITLGKESLVEAVEDYQLENPSNSYFNIIATDGEGVELTLKDDINIIGHFETKQGFINQLVNAEVLHDGQVIKSEDE